jgi:hypothetical protein
VVEPLSTPVLPGLIPDKLISRLMTARAALDEAMAGSSTTSAHTWSVGAPAWHYRGGAAEAYDRGHGTAAVGDRHLLLETGRGASCMPVPC